MSAGASPGFGRAGAGAFGPNAPLRSGGDGTQLREAERAQMHSLVTTDGEIQALLRDMRRHGAKLKPMKTQDLRLESLKGEGQLLGRAGAAGGGAVDGSSALEHSDPREGGWRHRAMGFVFGPILHPEGQFRSVWNALMALLIIYCGVTIPLEIAFEDDMVLAWCGKEATLETRRNCASFQVWFWVNIVIDLWFIADIVINLRTGHMVEGHFVQDDYLAARHYVVRGSFFFDCIGSFPINLLLLAIQDNDNSSTYGRTNKMLRLLRVAKMTKLLRLLKLGAYLEYVEVVIKFNPGLLRVIKLCLISLLCCHWFGCLWWLISDIEMTDESLMYGYPLPQNQWHPPPWLKYSDDFALKYWQSYFWGAGMALGMVPRDIEPVTTLEAVTTTMAMFGGLILAAVVISSFTSAFASMDNKRALAGQQLDLIRNYLLLKAVPGDLRARILEYYQYIFTSSQSMEDLQLLQHMPPNLATQLALSINAKLISRCAFFHEMSDASLATLVQSLTPLVFVPGQIICTEGAPLQRIYFINKGQVQLVRTMASSRMGGDGERPLDGRSDTPAEKVLRVVTENDSIGMDDFTTADRRIALSARALSYCDVMSLHIRDLDGALHYDAVERMRVAALRAESERLGMQAMDAAPSGANKRNVESSARLRRGIAMVKATSRMGPRKDRADGKDAASTRPSNSAVAKTASGAPAPADDVVECIGSGDSAAAASPSSRS